MSSHLRPDLLAEIGELRERVEYLEAEVAYYRELFAPPENDLHKGGKALGLPPWTHGALKLFLHRGAVRHEAINMLIEDRWSRPKEFSGVVVWHLRRALTSYGIHIHTLYGQGYLISKKDQAKLAALLEELSSL